MARFFVDELPAEGAEYELTGENAAHAKVLRLEPRETVTLCDGAGMECHCTVVGGLRLLAGEAVPAGTEPRASVRVFIAFPKADKAEHVIQKATELGAAEIILFPSRFCVSRPDGKSLEKKLERWQKIARSAAEQSRRGRIPGVRALNAWDEALKEAAKATLPILFYENEDGYSLHDALAEADCLRLPAKGTDGLPAPPITVSLMTGAEGGFAEEEIAKARDAGMKICTLGPRILRCETAPLAALSAVMFGLGEM